jgi:hypothetical protein
MNDDRHYRSEVLAHRRDEILLLVNCRDICSVCLLANYLAPSELTKPWMDMKPYSQGCDRDTSGVSVLPQLCASLRRVSDEEVQETADRAQTKGMLVFELGSHDGLFAV